MEYFNTTITTGDQLKLYNEKAGAQEKLVREIFEAKISERLTAENVYNILVAAQKIDGDLTPLTSIRRACSTLKKKGVVVLTTETTKGKFKRPIHFYSLVAA